MEVRYIEIKTSPAGQIIRAYTPEQYKKEMARRKNATARARKLTRLQERVGAVLAMLGFLMLLGAGGMCEIGQIIGYGLAGLFLFVFGVWLAHGFYGQADKAEWLREPYKDMTLAARRARESRWKAKTCSRVVHPRFGEVIVPHTSNYAAMLNAAEYWGCDWLEIIDDVEVWAVGPDAVPVKMPRHERNGR